MKKLENKIQNKPNSMDDEGKKKEILMHDDGFFNLINSQKNKKIKKMYFLIIKQLRRLIYLR